MFLALSSLSGPRYIGVRDNSPQPTRHIRPLRQLDKTTSNARKPPDGSECMSACSHASPRYAFPKGQRVLTLTPRKTLIKSFLEPLRTAFAHKYCTDIPACRKAGGCVPSAARNIPSRPGQASRVSADGTVRYGREETNKILRLCEHSTFRISPGRSFKIFSGTEKPLGCRVNVLSVWHSAALFQLPISTMP